MNKTIKISLAILVTVYVGLTIFPLKAVYKVDDIKAKPYDPKTTQLIEVGKKFLLLPGPKTVWAMKTSTGFNFYRGLPSPIKQNKPLFTTNEGK